MKKLFSLGLILALLLALFSGCHGPTKRDEFTWDSEHSTNFQFDTSRNFEISFWAKNDSNSTQIAIYNKAISDFEALYPNIKVNLKSYGNYGEIYQDVITNLKTNTIPNVCITYPDHIATYLSSNGVVVPLDELMVDPRYGLGGSEVRFDGVKKDEIISKYLDECTVFGKCYALPYMRSTEACYINKDMVEKLGYTVPDVLTWDFVWEVSQAAMAKDSNGYFKVNGQKTLIPFMYKSTDNMMIQYLQQANAGYATEYAKIKIFNSATKEFLKTISHNTALGDFSTFKWDGYPGNLFNAGQCIFAIDSTAGATWMGSHSPLSDIDSSSIVEFETLVRPVPQVDVNNPKMISQGPSVCVFNKGDDQEVVASWLFTQFLLTNDVQISYAQTEGYVPVTHKAEKSDRYQAYLANEGKDNDLYYDVKIQASKLLINNVDNTFVTPVFNGSASLRNAAGALIEEVVKKPRLKDQFDDAYAQTVFDKIMQQYKLDQIDLTRADLEREAREPLPTTSLILIIALVGTWIVLLILSVSHVFVKKRQRKP